MEQDNVNLLGYPEEFYEESVLAPACFVDLNLDQITAQIMAERRDYDLRRYFYRMPEAPSVTKRRQAVLRAFDRPQLFNDAVRFSEHMQRARTYAAEFGAAKRELVRGKFLLDCGRQYVLAVELLRAALLRERETAGEFSEILSAFSEKINAYVQSEKFQAFRRDTTELAEQFERMTFRVEFANRRMRVMPEEEAADYTEKLRALFPETQNEDTSARRLLENPFRGQKEPGELETFVISVCRKKYPESFERLESYEQKYSVREQCEESAPAFLEAWLLAAEQQLQVYLAVRLFMRRIEKTGYPLSFADFEEGRNEEDGAADGQHPAVRTMELRSCYDLALLLKQMYSGKPVVCNDAYYEGEERFLVVTGPNQGGKTTFARSVGQIVYFAKMGFAAPCAFARMPYFNGLLTHFSVEESLETGRGKLKEELVRLEPMMHKKEGGSFIILNELFTTAATLDAYIMGKRVMEHFMAQECFGIYVTHIQELAAGKDVPEKPVLPKEPEGMEGPAADRAQESIGGCVRDEEADGVKKPAYAARKIVSMAACVDEKDAHIRTYRIVRRSPEGVGYAYGLVEKYHLTYPELKERLERQLGGCSLCVEK